MAAIRLDNFHGLNTHADERKGAFVHALEAVNVDVDAASLKPVLTVNTAEGEALTYSRTIYHLDSALGVFLQWDAEVHVARSPTGAAIDKRVVYTGDDVPRVTDLTLATCGLPGYVGPAKSYVLGLPVPNPIRVATNTGGTGTVQDRAYVFTLVTPWGEESAPSEPLEVASYETGASVELEGIGIATARYTGAPSAPTGIVLTQVTFVGLPVPGFVQFDTTALASEFQPGDRFYVGTPTSQLVANQSYVVSEVGAGPIVRAVTNAWPFQANSTIFHVPPINRFSVIVATADTPQVGQVNIYMNSTYGLRVGEKLTFADVLGMTDLNGTFEIEKILETPEFPTVIISLQTSQVHTLGSGTATRTAPHNTGETRVTNVTHAAGVATIEVESTAHIEAGDTVLVLGVHGANEVNGLRLVTEVLVPDTIKVALASMTAATANTGVVMLPIPYAFREYTITAIAAAGGGPYPTAFTRVITIGSHDFAVGEQVIGYEIEGAVEMNTVMVVSAIAATTVTVSMAQAGAAYTTGGKLTRVTLQAKKRIYRTATGTADAEYQRVAEIGADQCRYTDTLNDADLGVILETDDYIQPPVDLHSIQAHPNRFLQGLSGNELCQTPANQPHAWPVSLRRQVPADAKALAIFDTTAVALTADVPYLFSGFSPSAMRPERVVAESYEATGRRGYVATPFGIAYRGRTGIWFVGQSQPINLTEGLLPHEDFTENARSALAYWAGKVMWHDGDHDGKSATGYLVAPQGGERALTQWEAPYPIHAMHLSVEDGKFYVSYVESPSSAKRAVFQDFSNDTDPARFTYKTQLLVFPQPMMFSLVQAMWDWHLQSETMQGREDAIIARMRATGATDEGAVNADGVNNVTMNGGGTAPVHSPDISLIVPAERYLRVTVVAEPDTPREMVVFDDFLVDDEPVKMARGVKAATWQVTLVGNAKVSSIALASTIREMRQV